MTVPATDGVFEERESVPARVLRVLLTERTAALALLTVLLVIMFSALGRGGYLFADFDAAYMASSLQSLVPVALLALAEMFVIISGYSGIDLSVGAIVSLAGMLFGHLIQNVGVPLVPAVVCTVVAGGLLGAVNGVLVGYLKFPPLIATLATQYAYASIAMVVSGSAPISGDKITAANGVLTGRVALFGLMIPTQVLTILVPSVLISWLLLDRMTWGRSLLAVGTNATAARYAAQNVRAIRGSSYMVSGLLCGLAAVVNVAQYASARPDAGTAGNGMALTAITIAALGGVLIQGGFGRVSGVVMAAVLITWLNAGLLISMEGSAGSRSQLLALGAVLICSILVNSYAARRYQLRS
ncbi:MULTISPECIES: ABC transporter permease [Actinomyces]|uniref:Abc transporter permease n=1 Tax=Actinomyces glycerinitolerans TaxID=1892869 RepID=A0A1M4RZ88_9ACTO|nr:MULTISPECIES: ABC transporter permease [Actinomyces]RAX18926.1 ABC transporter permease [Actinomyces sp. Z5]RAX24347.1 ABC transporter permease [Actinomyces sp. Z3]SHE25305.1 abc transporter permease [Actinomyces glycerinitolerans]